MSKSVSHLDLRDIAKNGRVITTTLDKLFVEEEQKRVHKAEIITGKDGEQLMKRVQKYLDQK